MSKCEADEQALAHRIFSVGHVFQGLLLLVHLLVLGHVGFVAEVVKVASVSLGVEFGDEGSTLGAESGPVDFREVLMIVDFLDGREALGFGRNATIQVSMG